MGKLRIFHRTVLLIFSVILGSSSVHAESYSAIYEKREHDIPLTKIDRLVGAELAKHDIAPANQCSDAVFIRRVFLDVTGTLPTPIEARSFLQSKKKDNDQMRLAALDHWNQSLAINPDQPKLREFLQRYSK